MPKGDTSHRRKRESEHKKPVKNKRPPQEFFPIPSNATSPHIQPKPLAEIITHHWQHWSTREKVAYVTITLFAMGMSIVAIYYLLPTMTAAIEEMATSNHVSPQRCRETSPTASSWYSPISFFNSETTKLEERIAKIPIEIYRLHFKSLEEREKKLYDEVADKIADMVRKNLPYVLNKSKLLQILSDEKHRILIVPKSLIDPGKAGYSDRTIIIGCDPELTPEHLRTILRNEYHHAGVHNTNMQKNKFGHAILPNTPMNPKRYPVSPFLSSDGAIDQSLLRSLNNSFNLAKEKVKYFSSLLNKNETDLTGNESTDLACFLEAVKCYQPEIGSRSLSSDEYKDLIKSENVSELPNKILLIKPGTALGANQSEARANSYAHRITEEGGKIRILFTHNMDDTPLSKAKAFVNDFYSILLLYTDGNYKKLNLTDEETLMEVSSNIEQFNTAIKELIFKDWCNYFEDYHNIKDYCSRDSTPDCAL